MKEKRNINIAISIFVLENLNLYIKYVGISKSACVAYFLSKQIGEFKYNYEAFMENWNKRRYRPIGEYVKDDGKPLNINRFSVAVSEKLYDELKLIRDKMKVSLPKLTTNMIISELESVFISRDKDLSYTRKQIVKEKLGGNIPISNVFKARFDTIAKEIGIPRNALISQVLAEYLIEHYPEFDDNLYFDKGKNYRGVW